MTRDKTPASGLVPSPLARLGEQAGQLTGQLLDLLLPPRCPGCGEETETDGLLCPRCWPELHILEPPWCAGCGLPFAHDQPEGSLCGGCLAESPDFDHARAAFAYDGVARRMVLGLKHGDQLHLAPMLAQWLYRLARDLPTPDGAVSDRPALLVPVPLHWRRRLARRFNQSAELARHLARLDPQRFRFAPDLVRRRRATPPQGSPQAPSRSLNVRGAFALRDPTPIQDAWIVLIDDVFTTGATVGELARLLRRGGAARIDVLCVTRVLKTD